MSVLVDTSVWSLALRRRSPADTREERELADLIKEGRVVMLGAIRQELLSGIRSDAQYRKLRDHLRAFRDHHLDHEDYENAAQAFNKCRRAGVQGSNTDLLICAVSGRNGMAIFTTDPDFGRYARVLRIKLHRLRRRGEA